MKVAVFRGGERLVAEDWPRPAIGAGELLLRLRGCGLCGSDIAKLAPTTKVPSVFGHELVGDVVERGAGVTAFAVGDRVVAAHHVPCGVCHYCRRGSVSMCREFKKSHLDPGGFAEFVRVPAPNVAHATFRLPSHVSDEAASFVEPLACCLRAVRRAGVQRGDTTAVIGLGSIGCLFVLLGKHAGATVVGVDPVAERRDLVKRLGADTVEPALGAGAVAAVTDGRGADQVIITGGGGEAIAAAATAVRDGGGIHVFAGGAAPALPVALDTLYHRELTITATYSSSPADLADAFRLVADGAVRVDGLISHRLPLERLEEAVALMRGRQALKVYVTP
ncbi:MAG: alcohol dehydrogenase catalytic domain-containing protein [Candidatus Rokubacteria bacterium]|nr:alcohol dehydrogenase catalytic domain-containing protein [Candidatus Rokubacteria bacterium]